MPLEFINKFPFVKKRAYNEKSQIPMLLKWEENIEYRLSDQNTFSFVKDGIIVVDELGESKHVSLDFPDWFAQNIVALPRYIHNGTMCMLPICIWWPAEKWFALNDIYELVVTSTNATFRKIGRAHILSESYPSREGSKFIFSVPYPKIWDNFYGGEVRKQLVYDLSTGEVIENDFSVNHSK